MVAYRLILSCEHGGNEVPPEYEACFEDNQGGLDSHRGYDPGALELAKQFAETSSAPLFYSTTTRLLVELNRSLTNRRSLFSRFTKALSPEIRQTILNDFYHPYRKRVEDAISGWVAKNDRILHLSVHSFTPVLDGMIRNADIGILYNPERGPEKAFSMKLAGEIERLDDTLRVRRNYPYRGIMDGFTTYLRTRFPETAYLGIELEINQKFPSGNTNDWKKVRTILADALMNCIS